MVEISGKYEHTHSENFIEVLTAKGLPEAAAKAIESEKYFEIKVEGDEVTITHSKKSITYKVGKETEEKSFKGELIKNVLTLNGNSVVIESFYPDNRINRRELVFNETGAEMLVNGPDDKIGRKFYRKI